MKRYHIDATQPIRPDMADAIYPAQLCGDGNYRQCVDVIDKCAKRFERWAGANNAVIRYTVETRKEATR